MLIERRLLLKLLFFFSFFGFSLKAKPAEASLHINVECVNCGACEPVCPMKAISEDIFKYVIDWERCTECVGDFNDPQCVEVCPVDAIIKDIQHIESREELLAKKERLHGGT